MGEKQKQAGSEGSKGHKFSAAQFLNDFAIGGTAGAIAKTSVAPLERVKLLIQTQEANPKLVEKPYTGLSNCFYRVFKEEGVIAFWRGNWANVVRYFPTTAFNFAFKDTYNKIFCPYDAKREPAKFFMGNLLSGGLAGASGLLIVYPLDFARTRVGVDIGRHRKDLEYPGMMQTFMKIYRTDGLFGLYRGFGISVAGIFVYRAFYFGGYDAAKKWMWGDQTTRQSLLMRFLIAQFITSTSETLSYPLDTVRRRLMMQSGQRQADMIYAGTRDCFAKIMRQEGWRAFFKGNVSNVFRSVGSSLVLVLYDELQHYLGMTARH